MSIRILVVDDNPDILANVRDFLSMKDGWAPETASTGLEALERIDRSTFDLVILDVGLPDTDGMTLTRRLRASGFTAPILMLTARDTIDDRVEGLTSGADDYLIKPFSLRELAARVEALQLLRELMQQSPGIVSRRRLEAVLWQGEPPASDSLRSNLYLLRQAVDKPFDHPLIHTHPGLGWSVADLPDSVS